MKKKVKQEDFDKHYSDLPSFESMYEMRKWLMGMPKPFSDLFDKKTIDWITSDLKIKKGFRILDVGCGDGLLIKEIIERLPKEKYIIYGIDITPIQIKKAKQRLKKYKNVKIISGNALKMPFKPDFFDVVIQTEVLEHIEQPEIIMKEMNRVLKPNGLLYLTTPNAISFNFYEFFTHKLGYPLYRIYKKKHRKTAEQYDVPLKPKRLGKIAKDSGFKVLKLNPVIVLIPAFMLKYTPRLIRKPYVKFAELMEKTPLKILGRLLVLKAQK